MTSERTKGPPPLFGHSINTFLIYSFEKLLESKRDSHDLKHQVLQNGDNQRFESDSKEINGSSASSDTGTTSKSSSESYYGSYFNPAALLQNFNDKSNIGFKRFVDELNLEEVRNLLYGTWDSESSELLWTGITSTEKDVNSVFNEIQIVTEDDLIKSKKKPRVVLSSKHLYDFVKYGNENTDSSDNKPQLKFEVNKKYVLLFGGSPLSNDKDLKFMLNLNKIKKGNHMFEVSNEVYYAEANSFKTNWNFIETLNTPEPRAFHGSCVIYLSLENPVFVVSGGLNWRKEPISNDLYVLNLSVEPLKWKLFKTNGPLPGRRYGHTLSHVGSHIVLFGGTDGNNLYNGVWTININDGKFSEPGSASGNCWMKVDFSGLAPSPRAFHSSCKVGISSNSPLVVYGGYTKEECFRNRIYGLQFQDNDKMIWNILPVYVKAPSEYRCCHSMTFVDDKFVINGGFDWRSDKQTNMRSITYCMESKVFNYTEDCVPLAGHCSWSVFGMLYHWGGLTNQNGNITFDEALSLSNPLYYSESSILEELYYKYIQIVTMGDSTDDSTLDEYKRKTVLDKPDKDKMVVDSPKYQLSKENQNVELEDNKARESDEDKSLTDGLRVESKEPKEQPDADKPKPSDSMDVDNPQEKPGLEPNKEVKRVEFQLPQSRPRRSAALKSLMAIELDHQRHLEKESLMEQSKEQSQQ